MIATVLSLIALVLVGIWMTLSDIRDVLRGANEHPKEQPEVDLEAFRREAAKAAMQGILASGDDGWSLTLAEGYKPEEKHSYPIGIARFAIACADELVKQLKEEKK